MVGNVLGGWAFAEREVRDLWTRGPRAVSPYQATAWFPAAAQGNINIRYGIKGRSRTFVCDRASGAYALIDAAQSIRRGKADVVLAGGTEQPLSPYAWLCCETGGFMTADGNGRPDAAYRPFDRRHNGMVIGEGSVFLVLESLDHARARGAKVYGEISGWAAGSDGYMPYYTVQPDGRTLAATMEQSLRRSKLTPGDLGLVVADAAGVPREDASEVAALRAALCDNGATVPVTSPKPVLSHLMGAAAVADVAVALRAMAEGTIPPIANLDTPAPGFDLDLVSATPRTAKALRHCLVVSRGLGGVNACLVISAPDSPDMPMAA
jgi:3-oxoacyl-(acyl-carrier-protein) synthase